MKATENNVDSFWDYDKTCAMSIYPSDITDGTRIIEIPKVVRHNGSQYKVTSVYNRTDAKIKWRVPRGCNLIGIYSGEYDYYD